MVSWAAPWSLVQAACMVRIRVTRITMTSTEGAVAETFRQPVDWSIFGVMGRANSSVGAGVKGVSNEGDGMSGTGGRYGAVLDGRVAPLRLFPAPAAGAPSSGYHLMGELLLDSHGDLFLCKASGTPGVWKQIA